MLISMLISNLTHFGAYVTVDHFSNNSPVPTCSRLKPIVIFSKRTLLYTVLLILTTEASAQSHVLHHMVVTVNVRCRSANQADSVFHPFGVYK